MLWTIFVTLLVMWLFGMVSAYTMGGFINIERLAHGNPWASGAAVAVS